MPEPLTPGETRHTPLPEQLNAHIEEYYKGEHHLISVVRGGIVASTVAVADYLSWQYAFDAAMDKAGL